MKKIAGIMVVLTVLLVACSGKKKQETQTSNQSKFNGAKGEVKLMTLDPGHFHAALVQKEKIEQVDSTVYVYAPAGNDLQEHLTRINSYNLRSVNPTAWVEKIYTGSDYFEKMLVEKRGNVVVLSGNNAKKTDYILKSVEAGINVLADKPMVITPDEFPKLEQAFKTAGEKGVLLYDIMTERFEVTSILQRKLSKLPEIFGTFLKGTPEEPAISMVSVHNFYKNVSGSALKRPAWFFDVKQQGEGIADVATHLVDLVQWEAFPEKVLAKKDIEILSSSHWTTNLTLAMFSKVTGLNSFPDYLKKDVENNILKVYFNGEFTYNLKGICTKVKVTWDYEAPSGAGDSFYSLLRGTKCNLVIRQEKEQGYKPTLYVEATGKDGIETFSANLDKAINQDLALKYSGIKLVKLANKQWTIEIPEKYKVGHEAHFTQVTENYLTYLKTGRLPEWEVPNMIVKYYTTTEALKLATE